MSHLWILLLEIQAAFSAISESEVSCDPWDGPNGGYKGPNGIARNRHYNCITLGPINCVTTQPCDVYCESNVANARRRRNLLQNRNLLTVSTEGCSGVTINCPVGFACNVNCYYSCQGVTINAQSATVLTVSNCGKVSGGCDDMTIWCPQTDGASSGDNCRITGGSPYTTINGLDIYAQESFYELYTLNINLVNTPNQNAMHCGVTATEKICNISTITEQNCDPPSALCEGYRLTTAPTLSPTNFPSIPPTNNPTKSPTRNPTKNPTLSPTKSPSKNPTVSPTKNPTLSPTKNPTLSPTRNPSLSPSKNPTLSPTKNPTLSPTRNPSLSPTRSPTEPTSQPTFNPTIEPTMDTFSPSSSPSIPPTTHVPTLEPTIEPTADPVFITTDAAAAEAGSIPLLEDELGIIVISIGGAIILCLILLFIVLCIRRRRDKRGVGTIEHIGAVQLGVGAMTVTNNKNNNNNYNYKNHTNNIPFNPLLPLSPSVKSTNSAISGIHPMQLQPMALNDHQTRDMPIHDPFNAHNNSINQTKGLQKMNQQQIKSMQTNVAAEGDDLDNVFGVDKALPDDEQDDTHDMYGVNLNQNKLQSVASETMGGSSDNSDDLANSTVGAGAGADFGGGTGGGGGGGDDNDDEKKDYLGDVNEAHLANTAGNDEDDEKADYLEPAEKRAAAGGGADIGGGGGGADSEQHQCANCQKFKSGDQGDSADDGFWYCHDCWSSF